MSERKSMNTDSPETKRNLVEFVLQQAEQYKADLRAMNRANFISELRDAAIAATNHGSTWDEQTILNAADSLERCDAEIVALKARVEAIQALVNEQAEDEALWTTPIKQVGEHWITNETVQEHLLKQALRGLLHTIKGEQHE